MSGYPLSTGEAVQHVLEGRECESEDGRRMTISSEGQRVDVLFFGSRHPGRGDVRRLRLLGDPPVTPFELIALRAKVRRWESKIYNDTALVIADGSLIYFDQTGRLFAHSAPEPSENTRKILTRPRMTLADVISEAPKGWTTWSKRSPTAVGGTFCHESGTASVHFGVVGPLPTMAMHAQTDTQTLLEILDSARELVAMLAEAKL